MTNENDCKKMLFSAPLLLFICCSTEYKIVAAADDIEYSNDRDNQSHHHYFLFTHPESPSSKFNQPTTIFFIIFSIKILQRKPFGRKLYKSRINSYKHNPLGLDFHDHVLIYLLGTARDTLRCVRYSRVVRLVCC